MTTTYSYITDLIATSQRPVIIAGQGVLISRMQDELRKLVYMTGIPVSHSMLGLGALPSDDPLCLGYHGHTGNQVAGKAIYNSDLLLVLGSRLDVRQVGTVKDGFAPNATIVRVDIDNAELEHSRVPAAVTFNMDLREFLPALNKSFSVLNIIGTHTGFSAWYKQIAEWRRQYPPLLDYSKLTMAGTVEMLNKLTADREVVVTTGVGMHQQFVARHFTFDYPKRVLLTSGGHGAMGYDLPSAIGAQLQYPDRLVLCVVGDGSFQMNIQELQTIVDYKLPIKIIVLDNNRLGMVSQFQLLNWDKDLTCGKKCNPNFWEIAEAYGIPSYNVHKIDQFEMVLQLMLRDPRPSLAHVHTNPAEDVLPMLLAGQTLDKMYPYE